MVSTSSKSSKSQAFARRLALCGLLLVACEHTGAPGDGNDVASLELLAPVDGSTVVAGSTVAVRVRALTARGAGRAQAAVTIGVASGTVTPSPTVTGADGVATATWTVGATPGPQRLFLSAAERPGQIVGYGVTIVAAPAPALAVARATSDTLRPGVAVAIEGSGFTSGALSATVAGVAVTVSDLGATRLTVGVPASLPCAPPSLVRITLRRSSGAGTDSATVTAPFDPAIARRVQPGEHVVLTDSLAVRCTRLDGGGRYAVAILNTSTAAPGGVAVQLRGQGAATTASSRAQGGTALSPPVRTARSLAALGATGRADGEHGAHLERERARTAALVAPAPASARRRAVRALPAVGDVLTLNAMYYDCATPTAVRARVAAVGARAVVLEDVASAGAGSRDGQLREIADEFDRVMYPLVVTHFGDPLALDGALGGDGRVRVLFSPYVADSVPNTIGFVTGCNFSARSQLASSNEAAVFYARLPNAFETAAEWRRQLRSTLVHETKHLAAYAERFARAGSGAPLLEETWLEEGTARVAEELYARQFSGATWKGNATFAPTVGCELTACDARPVAMSKHFNALAAYYARVDSLTPLGRVSAFDQSYYGSGWLLVRWAADRHAADEPTFFRALTTETTLTGIANLARRTGRSPSAMLGDWVLALAVDDRPAFTPRDPSLTIPSWNTRDVFRGMSVVNPFLVRTPFPLLERSVAAGAFVVDVPLLRSYTAAFVEIGAGAGAQLLSLHAAGGAAPPAATGLAIVRVE